MTLKIYKLLLSQSNTRVFTESLQSLYRVFTESLQSLYRESFRRMAAIASPIQSLAVIYKERMMNMPDELNTKKDIDDYSKKITKEIKEEAKNNKIEKAEKKKIDKKKKKNNLDDEGNEKPKRALTKYQQYIKDNQQRIRDEFPELSNTERFSKLAEEWQAYKATLEEACRDEEPDTDTEITNVSDDDEENPKKVAKVAKAAKVAKDAKAAKKAKKETTANVDTNADE